MMLYCDLCSVVPAQWIAVNVAIQLELFSEIIAVKRYCTGCLQDAIMSEIAQEDIDYAKVS